MMNTLHVYGRALRLTFNLFLAAAGGASGVSHAATTTGNLQVSAEVTSNCTISTAPLAFGDYDPIVANRSVALNGTGTVTTICTLGSAATITLGPGAHATGAVRNMASGSNLLTYELYLDAGRTIVWGNTISTGKNDTGTGSASTHTVYGQIPANQFKPAGNYSDTVVATVTF